MREKKPLLHELNRGLSLDVTGINNYYANKPSLIVANHTCLKDIFAVSSALPEASQIVLSARLMWKSNTPENSFRRSTIENSLYGIPLEVHGGQKRMQIGLEMAKRALIDGWSVVIFPEGAYIEDQQVNKGRTGVTRVLYDAKQQGVDANLMPIGINNRSLDANNLDELIPRDDSMGIIIGEPINYDEHYYNYINAKDHETIKKSLHAPVDIAMRSIARAIGQPYVDKYIELRKRDTIVLESGEEVPIE